MEKRVISLEGRVDRLEESHSEIKKSDDNQWTFIKKIERDFEDYRSAQLLTNNRLSELNATVERQGRDFATHHGQVQTLITDIKDQNQWFRDEYKSIRQTAADLEQEKLLSKRSWWDGFWKWLGILFGGGGAVVTAIALLGKLFAQ